MSEAQSGIAVLMVCMGNICRSPTAEGVLRVMHRRLVPSLPLRVDSGGTHAYYHLGEEPDTRSQAAAGRRGYDISAHRARMVTVQDFSRFDYVLAMDDDNLQHLRKLRRPGSHAELGLLLDYADKDGPRSVPDPYNGGVAGFERVLDLVEAGVIGLLRSLCMKQGIAFPDKAAQEHDARH
ncbi:MAG TPA: low molecular weight protein-tyrosine-phosphatase [Gammaproteobacteria bacterium]|nr:low molecular weight protein-tyrosine-phosphatase [Gammaproteobacteria bacterium]